MYTVWAAAVYRPWIKERLEDMTPVSPMPPAPALKPSREPRGAWPLLLALLIGFALPVLTCLALMMTAALSLEILTLGWAPAAPSVSA